MEHCMEVGIADSVDAFSFTQDIVISNKKYVRLLIRLPARHGVRVRPLLSSTEQNRRQTAGVVIYCQRSATVGII